MSNQTTCKTCSDIGWVTATVPLGHWLHGQAQPCPDCSNQTTEAELRREKFADLPNPRHPKTFDNWEHKPKLQASFEAAQSYANGVEPSPVMILEGPNGTGKSHLIEAIGRSMLRSGHLVKFTFMPDWLDALKATFDTSDSITFQGVFDSYAVTPEVLLMDDLGAERTTEWTIAQITRLFDLRYRNDLLTVVTTQYGETETEAMQGSRIADRLFDLGSGKVRVVSNRGESYRTGRKR